MTELLCNVKEGPLRDHILSQLVAGCFDDKFEFPYKVTCTQLVHNAKIFREYDAKISEMYSRDKRDADVGYGFVCETNLSVIRDVCTNGLWAADSLYNLLGPSSQGVYIGKYPDISMELLISRNQNIDRFYILIFKYAGKATKIVAQSDKYEPIVPTRGFDFHISAFPPDVNGPVQEKFNRSQLYFYEMNSEHVQRPRHVMPYAVIEYNTSDESHAMSLIKNPQLADIVAQINARSSQNVFQEDEESEAEVEVKQPVYNEKIQNNPQLKSILDRINGVASSPGYPAMDAVAEKLKDKPRLLNIVHNINYRLYCEEKKDDPNMAKQMEKAKADGQAPNFFGNDQDMSSGDTPGGMAEEQEAGATAGDQQRREEHMKRARIMQQGITNLYMGEDEIPMDDHVDDYLLNIRERAIMKRQMGMGMDMMPMGQSMNDEMWDDDYRGGYVGNHSAEIDMFNQRRGGQGGYAGRNLGGPMMPRQQGNVRPNFRKRFVDTDYWPGARGGRGGRSRGASATAIRPPNLMSE